MDQALSGPAREALTKSGWAWVSFVVGIAVMLLLAWAVTGGGEDMRAWWLFPVAFLWTVLVVPIAVLLRLEVVKSAWSSRPADPEGYRRGLIMVWAAIEVGAVLALIDGMFAGSLMPGGVLAGVLLAMLFVLRPSSASLGAGLKTAETGAGS